jgi:hypothetical protein
MKNEENDYKARELIREMFVDGEISREEFEIMEQNPAPFWKMVMREMGISGSN